MLRGWERAKKKEKGGKPGEKKVNIWWDLREGAELKGHETSLQSKKEGLSEKGSVARPKTRKKKDEVE